MNERNSPDVLHGWIMYGDVRLPYVERAHGMRLLARRLVDGYLLSYYPDGYEKQSVSRLQTFPLTQPESELLTRLCRDGLNAGVSFSTSDVALNLAEFDQYFSLVKHAYPGVRIPGRASDSVPDCDWILVRDSRVPSVVRDGVRLLPLNVLRGAAQVLIGIDVRTTKADPEEVDRLNKLCKSSGLVFKFCENTELVSLADLRALYTEIQAEVLQKEDPVLLLKTTQPLAAKNSNNPAVEKPAEIVSIQQQLPPMGLPQFSFKQPQLGDPSTLSEVSPPPLIPISNVTGLRDLERPKQIPISSTARANCASSEANDGRMAKPTTSTSVLQPARQTEVTKPARVSTTRHPCPAMDVGIKSDVEIVQVECYKRILTCIRRGKLKAKYALVESVMRLFFPRSELAEFIKYLTHELSVKLQALKRAEERALIRFYGIPTERLHSNLIIKVNDFVNRVSWLQQKFGPMDVPASTEGTVPDVPPQRCQSSRSSLAHPVAGRPEAPVCPETSSQNATAVPGQERNSRDRPAPVPTTSVPLGPNPFLLPLPQPTLFGETDQNAIKKIHGKISQEYHSYDWKQHVTARSAWNDWGPVSKMACRPYPLPSKERLQLDLVRSVPRINPEIVRAFGLDKKYLQ